MTSLSDSGNVGRLRRRFSPELLAFPSPDSDNHHEAASPKMALSPIGLPTRPKCPETAALRSLCSLRSRSDIGSFDRCRNENSFISTVLSTDKHLGRPTVTPFQASPDPA